MEIPALKKLKETATKERKQKDKKAISIAFDILVIFCVALLSATLMQKAFQNDTFYTIKIGQLLRTSGLDYIDHFSWHDSLPYMYPHWLYDLATSLVYDFMGGFTGVYIVNVILSSILGILTYITSKKITKNQLISFIVTLGQMYLLRDYLAARAQLVTFILFVLGVLFIEKYLEKPKLRYALVLIIIPIIIANVHSAVFPFYFVLFLPYIGEYAIRVLLDLHLPHKLYQLYIKTDIKITSKKLKNVDEKKIKQYQKKLAKLNKELEKSNVDFEKAIIKQNSTRSKPYKLTLERNDNVLKLLIIMIICLFTGLLTPIKDMPYTYTLKIMQGNTTKSINEHLPLTLIDYKPILALLTLTIAVVTFSKVKIRLRDLFFFCGLTLLALMTRRQISMLVLFGGFVFARIASDFFEIYDKDSSEEFKEYLTSISGQFLTLAIILLVCFANYRYKINQAYINESSYPIEASTWIKENLDYKNIRLYNDYNYGSYLLFEDIPVFIDSRCDLYTPEFNGTYNKEKHKYEGKDIFSDFMNISTIGTYYETKFEEYGVTHVITKPNSKIRMLISRDKNYEELYSDKNFVIYARGDQSKFEINKQEVVEND